MNQLIAKKPFQQQQHYKKHIIIERGKKGAADAAHAHAIPKAFAFPDALCKLF